MRRPWLIVLLAVVVAAPLALLTPVFRPDAPSPPVLTSADRAAIGDPGVERGADPMPPAVLPSSPDAVARAYLRAAHAGGDEGRSHRDAVAYAVPGSPAAVGVLVLDPPAAGEQRIAEVDRLDPAADDPARGRTAFVAELRTTTAAPGRPPHTERWRTQVVLHRDPGGGWLVAADTPITADTPEVDD